MTRVVVLAGGYGGAKMAHGFALQAELQGEAAGPGIELTVVGNTADDLVLHGLHISPDLDTVMYTLAGWANPETGWGVRGETWSAADMLALYGEPTWFRLGDRDLATHVVRTARLREGERLTDVTAHLSSALGVSARLLPMCEERVATRVRTADGWLEFQDYFVRRRHRDEVLELAFEGIAQARMTMEVTQAIETADLIVFAPSNPFVSIAPIVAVPGLSAALAEARAKVVAVSPIVGGAALRGPADRLLRSLAGDTGAAGIARHYAAAHPGLVDDLVLDGADAAAADEVSAAGYGVLITNTVISSADERRALAGELLGLIAPGPGA